MAIDDLPETAHPVAVIKVDSEHTLDQAVKKLMNIEPNVDAALAISPALEEFIREIQEQQTDIEIKYRQIIPETSLHPLPFFGVLDKARIITVGLNPSPIEFMAANRWPQTPLTAYDLVERLVYYFRQPNEAPHYWFAELQWALETLHCPYRFAAAHIDISPWATHSPTYLRGKSHLLKLFNELLDDGAKNWLPQILEFCGDTVKVVIICPTSDKPGPVELKRLQIVMENIRFSLGLNWNGIIIIKPKNEIPRWAWEQKEKVVRLLELDHAYP